MHNKAAFAVLLCCSSSYALPGSIIPESVVQIPNKKASDVIAEEKCNYTNNKTYLTSKYYNKVTIYYESGINISFFKNINIDEFLSDFREFLEQSFITVRQNPIIVKRDLDVIICDKKIGTIRKFKDKPDEFIAIKYGLSATNISR